jgi:hypothetical protein
MAPSVAFSRVEHAQGLRRLTSGFYCGVQMLGHSFDFAKYGTTMLAHMCMLLKSLSSRTLDTNLEAP